MGGKEKRVMNMGGGGDYYFENQKAMARRRSGIKNMDRQRGLIGKAAKAERRRMRQDQFLQDFYGFQLYRSLENMFDGTPTPEHISHAFKQVGKHERVVDRYRTKKGTTIEVTVVDLKRPNVV